MKNPLKTLANALFPTAKNSMSLPQQFLRYGSKVMRPDWTQVAMSDQDSYTGYGYAAIRKRANMVARLAMENVHTETAKPIDGFVHPHLEAIEKSPGFTDYDFWYKASTNLDLEGVHYLLVVRNFNESGRFGTIKEIKLLNPYRVRRVVKETEGVVTIGGYVESRNGYVREIPKEMIIEMREFNPFDENEPYAMSDAAKESQFTLKTAGDYTRHTLKHNINAPGIMSTDVVLPDEDFENFTSRVKNNTKGEPIFGNGKGAITWDSMNIDLSKASLKEVGESNRETQFAVYGMSKTIMGIEQSGVTRETAKVQKDLFNENEGIPRIQLVIGALNQDYRNNYPEEFAKNQAVIKVENPNATDHEAETKDIEAKQKRADLYNGLIEKGYDPQKAADYAEGKIDVGELGQPERPAVSETEEHLHAHDMSEKKNDIAPDTTLGLIKSQEGLLKSTVVNIEQHLVADCIERIHKTVKNDNEFENEGDIISKKNKREYISELELVLLGFYATMMQIQGGKTMRSRSGQFAMAGTFTVDATTKKYIKNLAEKVAEGHIETVLDDILVTARKAALEGKGQAEIIREVKRKYDQTISETRAKAIARTETNRAFTRAQYEADRQFIKQNKLSKRAYKRWQTRSGNACDFCKSLERQGLIPFSQAFKDLGDEIEVDGKVMPVNFEAIQAGNAHTNCSCIYELVILAE